MSKYQEIFKLKAMLETANIPFEFMDWRNHSFNCCQVGYPIIAGKDRVCSVIQSLSIHGGIKDKLEIWGLLTDDERKSDPWVGNLSADEVFTRIWRHWTEYHWDEPESVNDDSDDLERLPTQNNDTLTLEEILGVI